MRLCVWLDDEGDVRQWSVDVWDRDWELETIYVRPCGPFDDFSLGMVVSEAMGVLLERGHQLRLPL